MPAKADSHETLQKPYSMTSSSLARSERTNGLWSLRRHYIPRPELATCERHNSMSKLSSMCSDHGGVPCQRAMPPDVSGAAQSNNAEDMLFTDIRRLLVALEETLTLDRQGAGRRAIIQNVQRLVEEVRRPGNRLETLETATTLQGLLLNIRSCVEDLLLPKQVPLLSSTSDQRAASERDVYEDIASEEFLDEDPWEGYEDIASEDILEWLVDWSGHEHVSATISNSEQSSSDTKTAVARWQSQAFLTDRAISHSVLVDLPYELRCSFKNGSESVSTRSPTSSISMQSVCTSSDDQFF